MGKDSIDFLTSQWRRELPGINPWPSTVVARILKLAFLLKKETEEAITPLGLTWEAFEMIAALRRSGPPYQLKPTTLHGLMMVTSGAMTNRIDRAEALGLISRSPDPADRRGVIVTLEPKGIELAEEAMAAYYQRMSRLLAFLSRSERAEVTAALKTLLIGLEGPDDADSAAARSPGIPPTVSAVRPVPAASARPRAAPKARTRRGG